MLALATDRGSSSRLAQVNICLTSIKACICERMLESPGLYTETYIHRQQTMKIQMLTIIKKLQSCTIASRAHAVSSPLRASRVVLQSKFEMAICEQSQACVFVLIL